MRLVIEISEDTLLSDIQHSGDIVRMLRMIGIQIAIDDFGSGNTGLGMLRSIPVDFIKMDKSLVREAADSHEGRVILKKIAELCRDLGIASVVEGIETEDDFQLALACGCDLFQGYHVARPQPAQSLLGLYAPVLSAKAG